MKSKINKIGMEIEGDNETRIDLDTKSILPGVYSYSYNNTKKK